VLQSLGALWIGAIVGGVGLSTASWATRLPFVRALRAIVAGRPRPTIDGEVADTADTVAFALDAGLSGSAAVQAVAPYAPGEFGRAVRVAAADVRGPPHHTLALEAERLSSPTAARFADAFAVSASLGVPLAPALRTLADDIRERRRMELAEDVRRASVRVLVPLGLIVLPAFVLACLVPLFIGGLEGIAG
jgi:tight adherence protein C